MIMQDVLKPSTAYAIIVSVNVRSLYRERATMVHPWKVVAWALVATLATVLSYFSFRSYLGPDFLLHFASAFYC